jgi:hypothetical protein
LFFSHISVDQICCVLLNSISTLGEAWDCVESLNKTWDTLVIECSTYWCHSANTHGHMLHRLDLFAEPFWAGLSGDVGFKESKLKLALSASHAFALLEILSFKVSRVPVTTVQPGNSRTWASSFLLGILQMHNSLGPGPIHTQGLMTRGEICIHHNLPWSRQTFLTIIYIV